MQSIVHLAKVAACAAALAAATMAAPALARGSHGGGHAADHSAGHSGGVAGHAGARAPTHAGEGGSHVPSARISPGVTPHDAHDAFAAPGHAASLSPGVAPHAGPQSHPYAPSASTRAITAGVKRDEHGRIARDPHAKEAFRKTHPCPATGKTYGACPGYVVDHVQALKRGGADDPGNMQWQTRAEARAKDRWE